ncbi:MAG: thiamine phosphate synthase [Lachnospiraceae bacterium]|nr:thiamine phosphate synthase [Lachnospiraceae bacterium]
MKPKIDYTLYLCTDRSQMSTPTLEEAVLSAIRGGCTLIQLREKDGSSREFYETAVRIKAVTDRAGIPLIVNDRVDIALAVDAAGVHIGQSDLPAASVRALLGPDKILGVSAARVDEAVRAVEEGADYLGVGAMYATSTKQNTRPVSMEQLQEIRAAVPVPIVVIGGIGPENAANFQNKGIDGLAVVSSVIAQPDIEAAARRLKQIFRNKTAAE